MSDPIEAEMMKKAIALIATELDDPHNDWSDIENVDELRELIHSINRKTET